MSAFEILVIAMFQTRPFWQPEAGHKLLRLVILVSQAGHTGHLGRAFKLSHTGHCDN